MGWAGVSVLGFLVVTALVIWLARSNTARWEARHRAAQAAVRAREQASLRARAAALLAPGPAGTGRHRPHLHLPHVHLPPAVVARLPHPHVHLRHLHLPYLDGRLTRRRLDRSGDQQADAPPSVESPGTPSDSPSQAPAGPAA
ncbi:hypothetical protein ACI789_21280 [Geodermatophilus sp. SYSU D00965]